MTATLHALGCGRSAGAYYTDDPNREARPRTRDNYYSQGGSGTWWSRGSTIVRNGAPVDTETFRDLCAGVDPRTGKPLVRGAGQQHRAGWDITFSTPKTFGILWAAGTPQQRAVLERIQQEAVDQALQFMVSERLVEVRLGAGGRSREAPADISVAKFPHFTSREGDPACHTHSVLLNLASHGKRVLTVEPKRTYRWQLVLGSAFRTALAQKLCEIGCALRPAGRDQFEIAGIPEAMIKHFSRRSQQIKACVGNDASAAEKEIANLSTRRSKVTVPTEMELEERWKREFATFDIDPWTAVLEAGRAPRLQQSPEITPDFDPPEIPGITCVATAASTLLRTESVLTRKALLHRSFVEAALHGHSIETVYNEIANLEAAEKLVRLDQSQAGQHWTTPAIAAEEAKLLRLVAQRVPGSWFKSEAVEAALSAAPRLSEEQRQAIRLAASTDPVCLLEAGAGTGKTTLIKGAVDAARRSDLKVIGLAPSWVAADELSCSAGIEAVAIARFRHELASGQRSIPDANTVIIVDEAGMVGTRDMAAIFEAATIGSSPGELNRSPKILLSGDRRQLASVGGGSAMKAVSDIIGRKATLSRVLRQSVDWQRAASVVMAQGDSQAGLRTYAEHGSLDLIAGRKAALERAIEAWQEFRRSHGDDVLIVTRRNRDAVALNLIARDILRQDGQIRGDDLRVRAVDRDDVPGPFLLAIGDKLRFGETLRQHGIRNGTRGTIEKCWRSGDGFAHIGIRLEDGRLIQGPWSGFVDQRRRRNSGVPKVVHAIAGSAYSAQGRTASATVHYIGSATDARETYVALTRHRHDARIVVESQRLDAACRGHQADPRNPAARSAMLERLFDEAGRYHEKANVVDFAADRLEFIEKGALWGPKSKGILNILAAFNTSRRLEEVACSVSGRAHDLAAYLRQFVTSFLPDRKMPASVRSILTKVQSYAHRQSKPKLHLQKRFVAYEYER
ncbi:MobF family relaxase [Bradyrhizobium sp. F1.13.3]|uniref:MobF family relaxase n=1 Tax=Bradyrhizobium sp. F1.13.3 TaxID=3156351 RepID=UPI0033979CE9